LAVVPCLREDEMNPWDKPNPKKKSEKLSPKQKAAAKAFAKKTGTRYPSLVANMHGARKK
jgi:hypothetical protein